ncbi:MAG TPA: fumarylacetoacetate hydrolase family protein [Ilumatobacteraceae bacterium]|nr:fumarylacetoacetate hydrolase family protein [Ilumatobacteraceae bacterium]
MTINYTSWAEYLQDAVEDRREVQGIESQVHGLSIDDAYHIQDALIARGLAHGDSLAGAKLGLTSKAKQEQMGVAEPAYGWVPASSVLSARADVRIGELIHPRVEPEFVFVMGADLDGAECTAEEVLDATERVVGGIEVIDSRYEAFKFTLPDVIADNTSAARVAIGDAGVAPREIDLRDVECTFTVDGEVTGRATGAALLGSPAECVALLVRHLARSGRGLHAGWLVMAGAPLDARQFGVGTTATATYSHFGDVTVRGV